jgi:hypothetical protein
VAISRDTSQDCSNTNGSTSSLAATYAATATAGRLLVAVAMIGTTVSHVTIPSGWTTLVSRDHNSLLYCGLICYKVAAGNETGATFSVNNGATSIHIAAYQYSGITASSPADKSTSNDDGGGLVTTRATGTTATTAQADELIITAVGWTGSVTSPTWANATTLHNIGSGGLMTGERIVSATGTYSDTASWTTGRFANLLIGTFKAGASAAANATWWEED